MKLCAELEGANGDKEPAHRQGRQAGEEAGRVLMPHDMRSE